MEKIPVAGPSITQKEIDYVTDAVTNAWYANANIYNEKFEKSFAEYIGIQYGASLPSCTSGIHLALLASGVGPGDEVILPDATWIASAAPITYVGATPVFADIEADTWCLSARSFEECITPRTKAVIPVDLYGGMPEYNDILSIAKKKDIFVIEDAAEAVGSEYNKFRAGYFGDVGVFSFHGSKTLTTGEGGMLVTDDKDIYDRVQFLRDHGRRPGDVMFFNEEVAYKYKMSSMQAALGLAQLERINELVDKKRDIFSWYKQHLEGLEGIRLNHEPENVKNTYWMVTAIIDKKFGLKKEDIIKKMAGKNIMTRPFFHPLSSLPAYQKIPGRKSAQSRNKVSYDLCSHGINLPSGFNMTEGVVGYVCETLNEILKG
ncbi:MAG: DegT/DnrJ/EryC1/StrS family aminotransferase [Desulfobacteraceae bacterium]|jgi:perosamine synthetase|nr:DegT/DnrJ/EryC1/StrS family aminotransferase [Desulfobacteraceae bacterium]